MALNIKSDEADRLARALADLTGESLTTAIIVAVTERLERLQRLSRPGRAAELALIWERAAHVPRKDPRSADELLGYTADGTFE